MRKNNLLVMCSLLIAAILVTQGFAIRTAQTANYVFLYGLVYEKANCAGNVRTAAYHVTTYSEEKNYKEYMKHLEKFLKENYPAAVYIRVGSSRFDYGPDASHFYLLSVKIKNTSCNQREFIPKFGKSLKEARDAAEKVAKGIDSEDWDVKESKYW